MAINLGLIGFGTVGTGTVKTLLQNQKLIDHRAGTEVRLKRIADLDTTTDRGVDLSGIEFSNSVEAIFDDPEIDIVIELVGGTTVAKTFIEKALKAKKHVITANKALLAYHGEELFGLAQENGVYLAFEAAVGGAIPIMESLNNGLASARIDQIYGIINGTSNYILTEMMNEGESFDAVLREAQALGYAEADPTFDVEGHDTAHKIALLASCCFGTSIPFEAIHMSGIRDVTVADIEYANTLGYELKLLAVAKDHGEEIEIRVHPTFIPKDSPLAPVHGVFNAILVKGFPFDEALFYGRGAGDLPTGGAVVSDIVQVARRIGRDVPGYDYSNFTVKAKKIKSMDDLVCSYYMRITTTDRPGVLGQITNILGKKEISIASFLQREKHHPEFVPIVIMTHDTTERNMQAALEEISQLDVVQAPPFIIRVEHI